MLRMARAGLHDLHPWHDPERGRVDPMRDPETIEAARRFLTALWAAQIDGSGAGSR